MRGEYNFDDPDKLRVDVPARLRDQVAFIAAKLDERDLGNGRGVSVVMRRALHQYVLTQRQAEQRRARDAGR